MAAALPHSTLSISAPELAGAIVVGTELAVALLTQLGLPPPVPVPPPPMPPKPPLPWPSCD